jgi:hypothetical protein
LRCRIDVETGFDVLFVVVRVNINGAASTSWSTDRFDRSSIANEAGSRDRGFRKLGQKVCVGVRVGVVMDGSSRAFGFTLFGSIGRHGIESTAMKQRAR